MFVQNGLIIFQVPVLMDTNDWIYADIVCIYCLRGHIAEI